MSGSDGDSRVWRDDVMMVDLSEKGRLPGEPPDGGGSWAKKVMGMSAGGRMVPEKLLDDEFVASRLSVDFPDGENGEPVITIEEEVLAAMNGLWKRCMIVKVLGRSVPIDVLSKKLRELWRPKGEMYVLDLPRKFFMVRFGEEEEYLSALTGGPWKVFGSYLMVQAWTPEFDPTRDSIVTTPVWVRLAHLPINFYHKAILMGIAKGLGKPILVDDTTLNLERAQFARVCIEVDLRKPLKGSVLVNKERYYVSYEGITNICSGCGLYGHMVHQCPQSIKMPVMTSPSENAITVRNSALQGDDGFTAVRRSERRGQSQTEKMTFSAGRGEENAGQNLRVISGLNEGENVPLANSFGSLEEDGMESGLREDVGVTEEKRAVSLRETNGKNNVRKLNGQSAGSLVRGKSNGVAYSKEKQSGVNRPAIFNGVRPKTQQNRPTRGLVFGAQQSKVEISVSGKRLRVEKQSVGRPGGVFEHPQNASIESSRALSSDETQLVEETSQRAVGNGQNSDGSSKKGDSSSTMELVEA